jgi:tetratricopeptide (TPR) repeat protein
MDITWLVKEGPKILEGLKNIVARIALRGKDRVVKNYYVFKRLKLIGAAPGDDSFDTIYNEALYRFEHQYSKHPLLIKLFADPSAKASFKSAETRDNADVIVIELNAIVYAKSRFSEIKSFQIDFAAEVRQLSEIFREVTRDKIKPVDAQSQKDLLEGVRNLVLGAGQLQDTIDLSDTISDLDLFLKGNKQQAAIDLLLVHRGRDWDKRKPEIKYKITAKLGLAYFQLQDYQNAAKYFAELLDFNQHLKDTYGYVALGFSTTGRHEEAVRYAKLAIGLDPVNANAYLALLLAAETSNEQDVILPEIPLELAENEAIALNMAMFKVKKGDFSGARIAIEKINERHGEPDYFKAEILNLLAQVIVQSNKGLNLLEFGSANQKMQEDLKYAAISLTEAWDIVRGTELQKSRWYIAFHLGIVKGLLGLRQEAQTYVREALDLFPNFHAYGQYWRFHFDDKEKQAQIVTEMEGLKLNKEQAQELLLMKVESTFDVENPKDSLSELQNTLPLIEKEDLKILYYDAIIHLLIHAKDYSGATLVANELANFKPDSPYGTLYLGKIAILAKDWSSANEYFTRAAGLVDKGDNIVFADDIAKGLIQIKNFDAAIELLERTADKDLLSTHTRLLLTALYRADRDKAALDLASALLVKSPVDTQLIDTVASIYEKEGKFEEGIAFLNEVIGKTSDHDYLYLKLTMLYYKNNKWEDAADAGRRITNPKQYPINLQFMIADAFIKSGQYEEGMERAYHIRNEHYGKREAHTFYMQLNAGDIKPHEYHYPTTVQKDNAIELESDTKSVYIIVDEPKYPGEVGMQDAVTKVVMGKSIDEEIEISNMKYRITSIKTKYTHAFHDTLQQIPIRFGNEGSIKVGRFDPDMDPKESLKRMLANYNRDSASEAAEDEMPQKLQRVYGDLDGAYTLGTLAMFKHDNIINFWRRMIHDAELGIIDGSSDQELHTAEVTLHSDKGIILDIIGVLTIHVVGIIDIVKKIEIDWYVTRSTWQLLEDEFSRMSERPEEASLSIDWVGEELFSITVSAEDRKKEAERFRSLIEELRTIVTIVESPVSEDFKEKSTRDEILGKSFYDSIEAAQGNGFLLYSDDAVLRFIAAEKFKAECIGTPGFLRFGLDRGIIDICRFEEAHARLIRVNYRQIPISPRIMLEVLKKSKQAVQFPFTHAVDLIDSQFLGDEQAVVLVADFLLLLFKEPDLAGTRTQVTRFVLGKLFADRNIPEIKRILLPALTNRFRLLPLQFKGLKSVIDLFT